MSKDGSSSESPAQDASAGDAAAKDANIYENRGPKKIIRIITVMAYMFSVSFVAIVLSAYYLFLWEPPNPRLLHRTSHLRGSGPHVQFLIDVPPNLRRFSKTQVDEIRRGLLLQKNFSTPTKEKITIRERLVEDEELPSKFIRKNTFTNNMDESLASLRSTLIDVLRAGSNDTETSEYFTVRSSHSPDDSHEKVTATTILEDSITTSSIGIRPRIDIQIESKEDTNWNAENITNSALNNTSIVEEGRLLTSGNTPNEEMSGLTTIGSLGDVFGSRSPKNAGSSFRVLSHQNKRFNKDKPSVVDIFRGRQNRRSKVALSREGYSTRNDSSTKRFDEEINSTETQIEKMTTRSITVNDDLQRSEIPSTTAGYKGLLRILTETVENENISSPIYSSTIPIEIKTDTVTIAKLSNGNKTRN